jgi:ribosome-associated translation inhibitor RaiA
MLEARVTLKLNNTDDRDNMVCQIRGTVSGKQLFAEKHASTFKEAAIKTADDMKRQLTALRG